jgi:glycosyltransferase involved in cell wall biosynthesis
LKILQIIQRPQLRGAEIFACQLSGELQKLGAVVDVVYLFNHTSFDLNFDLNFISLNAQASKRFWDVKAYKKLDQIIRDGNYDIVQANAGDTLKYAALSKLLYRWKAKLVFRNANKMSGFIKGSFHLALTRFFLRQCDYIISVSENCRIDICSLLPSLSKISATVSIGTFDFTSLAPIAERSSSPVWVNIGSFVPEKNHTFLIDIFAAYFAATGKGTLWLIGDGALKNNLRDKIEKLGLSAHVKLWGYQQNPVAILKAADVLVMPSKIEGMPAVILEAFSAGVPVVAAAVGGIPEIVANEVTGFCISGYDIENYNQQITRLINDKNLRERIIEHAHTLVIADYTLNSIASKFMNRYAALVK